MSLKSPMTLRKSFNPLGLLSHGTNGETFAHSAFLLYIVQVYREIPEIRDGKAHQKLECTLHKTRLGQTLVQGHTAGFMADLERRPRCQDSQAKQTGLLFRSAQWRTEPPAAGMEACSTHELPMADFRISQDQLLGLTRHHQRSCLCLNFQHTHTLSLSLSLSHTCAYLLSHRLSEFTELLL